MTDRLLSDRMCGRQWGRIRFPKLEGPKGKDSSTYQNESTDKAARKQRWARKKIKRKKEA
jgi:hypothetical protein